MKKLVDKSVKPEDIVKALAAGDITFAQAQALYNGVIPIGDFKGAAAALDVDLLVKQPLVLAEQLHILGILDGREEDYDLQTVTIPTGAAIGASVAEQLTVPAGEVWYVTTIVSTLPADAGGIPTFNWHCSLWTSRLATPSPYGQSFHAAAFNFSPGGGAQHDEFSGPAPLWLLTNKPMPLRLPGGTVLTFVATNTNALATADMACTARLYGFIGKSLVD